MMIKRLSASFGRLSGEALELQNGLNIIEAPNECGKSTWCAFIRTMLFGLRADRDKQGYLSDKTRYRPWNGAPMEGSVELEADGVRITLERSAGGKLPMRDFRAFYSGTGLPYPGLSSDTAGETLLGISEDVFVRSAFISQAAMRVGQTPELEKRISTLVSTGDETSSYSEADDRLRLWQRKRRFNKLGTIPALEEKLQTITKKLYEIAKSQDVTAEMRLEAERLKEYQGTLASQLKAYDRYEALEAYRNARERLNTAKARYDAVLKDLTRNGPAPSAGDIAAIRGDLKALVPLKKMQAEAQRRLDDARDACRELLNAKKALPFGDQDAALVYGGAVKLEQKLKQLSSASPLTVATILLFAAAGVTAVAVPNLRLIAGAAALLFLVIGILRTTLRNGAREKLRRYLSGFGADSTDSLMRLCDDDARLSAALIAAEGAVKSAEQTAESAASACGTILQPLENHLMSLSLNVDLGSVESELLRIEALMNKLAESGAELAATENYLRAVTDTVGDKPAEDSDVEALSPARSRQTITTDLTAATARLEDLGSRYNMALGEIRAMGDPAILGSEKKAAEAELLEQRAQLESLTLAVETLRDAHTELQTRFSPLLSETAGKFIQRLTGDRYEKLVFDKSLDAAAKTRDDTVSRSALALSAGTSDQLYLSLRLAIVELVLPEKNACPLILDDALSNFDDTRAQLALDYLKELAGTRQILLFTCHGREGAYFSGDPDVNVIRFK